MRLGVWGCGALMELAGLWWGQGMFPDRDNLTKQAVRKKGDRSGSVPKILHRDS